ncbi:hypothetical protein DFH28DRAFT_1027998, partial [Melampsora americana]
CTQSQSYTVSGGEKWGSRPVRLGQFHCPCAFIVKLRIRLTSIEDLKFCL